MLPFILYSRNYIIEEGIFPVFAHEQMVHRTLWLLLLTTLVIAEPSDIQIKITPSSPTTSFTVFKLGAVVMYFCKDF